MYLKFLYNSYAVAQRINSRLLPVTFKMSPQLHFMVPLLCFCSVISQVGCELFSNPSC